MNRSIRCNLLLGDILSLALLLFMCMQAVYAQDETYRYFSEGDPTASGILPARHSQSSLVLMGGGSDVDQAFRWMIRKAGVKPGTGGHFVVLRASGTDAYNPYIYYSGPDQRTSESVARSWVGGANHGLSSVETLVIPSRSAAEDPFVNAVIRSADVLFIAGGDQSQYIRFWKGTALDRSLAALLSQNVPVGGTSAGLAILGEYTFAAMHGTIDSTAALFDPFDRRITIDPDPQNPKKSFLAPAPLLGVLTDSHFDRRKRMGRLVAFLSRLGGAGGTGCPGGIPTARTKAGSFIRGIGVSEQTALLIESTADEHDFIARRIKNPWSSSEGAVYFVRPQAPPSECEAGAPLTIAQVEIGQ